MTECKTTQTHFTSRLWLYVHLYTFVTFWAYLIMKSLKGSVRHCYFVVLLILYSTHKQYLDSLSLHVPNVAQQIMKTPKARI